MILDNFDKNTCSQCNSALIPREHWKCCPNCEPHLFPQIPDGFALVRKPELLGKGTPKDRQT